MANRSVIVTDKKSTSIIVASSGPIRKEEVCTFINKNVDLKIHDFNIYESVTHEYIQILKEDGSPDFWVHEPRG